jgi:hypothetical protein
MKKRCWQVGTVYKRQKKDMKREAKTSQFEVLKFDAIALAESMTP